MKLAPVTAFSMALAQLAAPANALSTHISTPKGPLRGRSPSLDTRMLRDAPPDFSGLDPKGRRVNFYGDFFETPDAPPGGDHLVRTLPGEEIYIQFVADTGAEDPKTRGRVLSAMQHDLHKAPEQPEGAYARFLLGDNIYEYGATGPTDPAIAERIDIFGGAAEQLETFAILGNHDLGKKKHPLPDAYAYTDLSRPNHNTPVSSTVNADVGVNMISRYYDVTFRTATGKPLVQVILLDTNVLAKDPDQQAWLEQTLKNSTAQHVFIAGHHPLKSIGPEHLDPPPFAEWLSDLAEKYQVSGMFSGHEHNLQARLADNLPPQFIVGAGSKMDYPPGSHHGKKTAHAYSETDSITAFGEPGFGTLQANSTHAEISLLKAKKSHKTRNLFQETLAALPPRIPPTMMGNAQETVSSNTELTQKQNAKETKPTDSSTHWFAIGASAAAALGLLTAGAKWVKQKGLQRSTEEQISLLPLVEPRHANYGGTATNNTAITLTV